MADRVRNLGGGRTSGTRVRNLGPAQSSSTPRARNLGVQTNSTGPHPVHGIGGFFHNFASGAEAAARGFGPGLATFGSDFGHDAAAFARHPIGYQPKKDSKLRGDIVLPLAHSYASKYGHDPVTIAKNIYADPFGSGLDALTVASFGAGAIARGGAFAGEVGAISKASKLAQLSREAKLTVPDLAKQAGQVGKDVTIKMSSRNPLIRSRQVMVNKLLNKANPALPVVGSRARLARAVARPALKEAQALALKSGPFKNAFARLSPTAQAVWHLRAQQLDPEGYARLLKADIVDDPGLTKAAMISALEEPKLNQLYHQGSKKITRALELGRQLSDVQQAAKLDRGYIGEQAALERPYLPQRLLHGAEITGKKDVVSGKPSAKTAAHQIYVNRLQGLFDRQTVRTSEAQAEMIETEAKKYLPAEPTVTVRPRTLEEAQARFAELDAPYQAMVKGMAEKYGHPTGMTGKQLGKEAMDIGKRNAKRLRQEKGITKTGRKSGASGPKSAYEKLPNDVIRNHAEAMIAKTVAEGSASPKLVELGKLIAERDDLKAAIEAYAEQSLGAIAGDKPPDFGTVAKTVAIKMAKARKGEASTPEEFAAVPLGAKVLTHDNRLLTPPGGARAERYGAALGLAKEKLDQMQAADARRLAKKGGARDLGIRDTAGNSIPEIAQRLADEGKDQPFYVPHSASVGKPPAQSWRPSSLNPPAVHGATKMNLGTLLKRGMINLHGDSLSAEHARFTRHIGRTDINAALQEVAAKEPASGLPQGYSFLKQVTGQKGATYTERSAADLKDAMKSSEDKGSLRDRFTTRDPNDMTIALDGEGHRLIVPDSVAKLLSHEAQSTRSLPGKILFSKPTSIWKHLVLGLRPAYMANIVLSQHVLGALQMAPDGHGIYAYINHLVPGARLGKLSEKTLETHFPEQAHGAFSSSEGATSNKGLALSSKIYQGVMPATLRVEHWLRKLMVDGWASSTPEIRAVMKRNGGDINAAIDEVAQTDPHVLQEISLKVDHAQGNYRNYNAAEQKLRAVVPFYGWDRHIVQSTYRILAEHPLRASLAGQLGTQGHAINQRDFGLLPTYLQDLVRIHLPTWMGPLGGRTAGFSTKAVSPFAADADIGALAIAAVHAKSGGHAEEFANINPLITGAIEQYTGRSLLTGAPLKDDLPFGLGNVGARAALGVPQARLLESLLGVHPLGKPAPNPAALVDWKTQLASILGVPVKKLDLPHEHLIAGLQHTRPK